MQLIEAEVEQITLSLGIDDEELLTIGILTSQVSNTYQLIA